MTADSSSEDFPTIQISSLGKFDCGCNVIVTSSRPSLPVLVVSNIPLYYTPANLCTLLSLRRGIWHDSLLLLSTAPPSFVVLLAVDNPTPDFLREWRDRPNSICSFDHLDFHYFHSFSFDTTRLAFLTDRFLSSGYRDGNCVICLNPCTSTHPLFIFSCGHVLHTKCVSRMQQWECPVCRYAPLSSLGVTCCEICHSFDRPFVCLSCGQSYCEEHNHDHFLRTGHAYCCSADGREGWNVMSESYAHRIAYDKSGEFVELCAKEDQLQGYLEGAIQAQVDINRTVSAQRIKAEIDKLESRRKALQEACGEKRAKIEKMKATIGGHETRIQRRVGAQKLLDWLREREEKLARENAEARERIAGLEVEVSDQTLFVRDIEQTVSISGSAALAGKTGKVHIKFQRPT